MRFRLCPSLLWIYRLRAVYFFLLLKLDDITQDDML